ncbi:MAG: DUF4239 domain-containing protein [Isosphaeraceae bacterium]
MNFYWLYGIPTPLLAILILSVFNVISVFLLLVTRPLIKQYFISKGHHNEIASYYFASISLIYALILGQVTSITYENFQTAKKTVSTEASEIVALMNEIEGYAHPLSDKLDELLIRYVQHVIQRDFPEHRDGIISSQSTLDLDAMEELILKYEPASSNEIILHGKVLDNLNNVVKARAERIQFVSSGLPRTFWGVIFMGSIVTIASSFLLYFPNKRLHVCLVSLLSTMIGLVVFLCIAMDNPFRGDVSVTIDGYQDAIEYHTELKSNRFQKPTQDNMP